MKTRTFVNVYYNGKNIVNKRAHPIHKIKNAIKAMIASYYPTRLVIVILVEESNVSVQCEQHFM